MYGGVSKSVKRRVIGRVHRNQLTLQMSGQFGHFDAIGLCLSFELVAIGLGCGRLVQIEQARVPTGHLYALVSTIGGPFGDGLPGIERRVVACKLRQKQRRAFDGFHE